MRKQATLTLSVTHATLSADLLPVDGQHQEGSSIPPTQAVPIPTPELPVLPTPPSVVSKSYSALASMARTWAASQPSPRGRLRVVAFRCCQQRNFALVPMLEKWYIPSTLQIL